MRFKVNENCIGCGMCASVCPEVFSMTEEGTAQAKEGDIRQPLLDQAQEAADGCPVSAIESEP